MRRAVDIAIALVLLPLLSPLLLLISVAIILESRGNPFYGGWRMGQHGRRFRMWKFRTMVVGADRIGGAITTPNDSRITQIGRFLRKSKLDELPQFFNLLKGDLTLIGPRPEDPRIAENFTVEQKQILSVKPGITGPVQLSYTVLEAETIPDCDDADKFYVERVLDQKLRLDLDYLKTRTVISDGRVLLRTLALMARALTQSGAR